MKPYCIGLMSGTSMDGIDAALCKIEKDKVVLDTFISVPYSAHQKALIARSLNKETARLDDISSLNFSLGQWLADASLKVIEASHKTSDDIEFIASHGQTIWHEPHPMSSDHVANTLQIGSPAVIAAITGITTISDFRSRDVALGGEGAPLVPMTELKLYGDSRRNQAFLNIGGISNVTFIPKNLKADDIIAFDCGPGNCLSDGFTKFYFNEDYDNQGHYASQGNIIPEMLNEILNEEAIQRKPPKSTGRELFSKEYMLRLEARYDLKQMPYDAVRTAAEATVQAVVLNIEKYLPTIDTLVVSGGGSHNDYMMAGLKKTLAHTHVMTGDEAGINSDAKEAIAFAELGLLTVLGESGNAISVTGAKDYCVLGSITPGNK